MSERMSSCCAALVAAALAVTIAGCLPATRRMSAPQISTGSTGAGREASTASAQERLAAAYTSPTLSYDRRIVLQSAEQWLGTPYRYGGNTREGVDCSGFVCKVFGAAERRLPRTSREQSQTGEPVPLGDALPGDLVFFNTSGGGVSHVGILLNTDEFVHASTSRGVIVSSLSEKYYRERIVGVRRVF